MGKHKCPEFENHERWLISFADMLTLLFAVFVVLYALSMAGKEDSNDQVAGSMQESFDKPLETIPPDKMEGPSENGWGIFENFQGDRILPPIVPKFPGAKQRASVVKDEMMKVKVELEDRLYGNKKFRELQKSGQERVVSVVPTEKGFSVRMLARHFYNPGEVAIKRSARKELDEVVQTLKKLGRNIRIEGHTDNIPPKSNYTNWELSALRSAWAVRYVIRTHRFPRTAIHTAGYADTQPIASNNTRDGRELNRRIEIKIDYDPVYSNDPR